MTLTDLLLHIEKVDTMELNYIYSCIVTKREVNLNKCNFDDLALIQITNKARVKKFFVEGKKLIVEVAVSEENKQEIDKVLHSK